VAIFFVLQKEQKVNNKGQQRFEVGAETMKKLIEDIMTVCTLLAMGTAIVMWGSIGQALAG